MHQIAPEVAGSGNRGSRQHARGRTPRHTFGEGLGPLAPGGEETGEEGVTRPDRAPRNDHSALGVERLAIGDEYGPTGPE